MKSRIAVLALLAVTFLMAGCAQKVDDSKKVPNKEAKEWRKNLHNSPYSVYENFDNAVLDYEEIKKQLTADVHIKLYMGSNLNLDSVWEYRLFILNINGEEAAEKYTNDYNTVRYFADGKWIPSSKEELQHWATGWSTLMDELQLPRIKGFVVPNADILAFKKKSKEIYIAFGLKTEGGDEVKPLFTNKKRGPKEAVNLEQIGADDDEMNMDACMPCPRVCAGNEIE
jgi:hypothetical protein